MIDDVKDRIIQKKNIPREILNQIPLFDPVFNYHIENEKLNDLNKNHEKYQVKLEGIIKLKELLEKDVEQLIFNHGEKLNSVCWTENNPQCYYRNPSGKKIMACSYKRPSDSRRY